MRTKKPLSAIPNPPLRLSIILALLAASGLASALTASRPAHADHDYDHSMRLEGNKLERLDQSPATADEKKTGVSIKDFEAALLQDSPDSYRIYQQLSAEKRMAVFKFYLEERNLKPVRRRIIDLRLGI